MKKNISINISGMIFYIEEDCYDQLKAYLNSVYKYFANYEDGKEIIEDINNRIAEIFYSNLHKSKQVITQTDVEELMATMGSIEDFMAIEDDPAYQMTYTDDKSALDLPTEDDFWKGGAVVKTIPKIQKEQKIFTEDKKIPAEQLIYADAQANQEIPTEEEVKTYKRLYRDMQRKVLGGVSAGLAHYLGIDAIWIRLVFIFMVTGMAFLDSMPEIAFLVYISLWIAMPKNENLEENTKIRKLFRNNEKGVLGGVSAGLATFWGVDVMTVRIIFILALITFGTGIFVYVVLWAIIPEAKTLTDKMQMEGQPINLKNIEFTIRENMLDDLDTPEQPNKFNQAVLMPFYILANVLDKLKIVLSPLVSFTAESIRIGGGILLVIISTILLIALTAVVFAIAGWGIENVIHLDNIGISAELIRNSFDYNIWMLVGATISVGIPALFLGMFGASMLSKRIIWSSRFGWSVGGLWLLSLIGTGVSVGMMMNDFRHNLGVQTKEVFELKENTLLIQLNLNKTGFIIPELTLKGYEGSELLLYKQTKANGRNERDAKINMSMLTYDIKQKDSILLFDEWTHLKPNAKYRRQKLSLELNIPYEKVFAVSPEVAGILRHTLYPHGYETDDLKGNLWKFTKEKLVCITCEKSNKKTGKNMGNFNFSDFEGIEVNGALNLKIRQGKSHSVQVFGDEKAVEMLDIDENGDRLEINMKKGNYNFTQDITLEITLPTLENITLNGASNAEIFEFDIANLEIELNGVSKLSIKGKAEELKANLSGASQLNAFDFRTQNAEIELSGASQAKVFIKEQLKADVSGASKLRYKGNPQDLQVDKSGAANVAKE